MTRILIIGESPICLHGMRDLILGNRQDCTVDEACNAPQAAEMLQGQSWDALVVDTAMLGDTAPLLTEARKTSPSPHVLVVGASSQPVCASQVFRLGADGYLTKNSPAEEFISAIDKVLAGGKYVSSAIAEQTAVELAAGGRARHESLSNREFAVMSRLAVGVPVKLIAREMGISIKTVSTFRSRILHKMGMKSNADLTRYALRCGLID